MICPPLLSILLPKTGLDFVSKKKKVGLLFGQSTVSNISLSGLCYDSLVAQRLKHLPVMQETWVRSLGREHPLEKEMATHSSILAWRIPWTEKPGRLLSIVFAKS